MEFIGILIVIMIIGAIMTIAKNLSAKAKIAINKDTNPEKAAEAAEDAYDDDSMSLDAYEAQLIKIAESSQSPEVMRKLVDLYTTKKENKEKAEYWNRRASQSGDFESIGEFYGFSDYDISYSDCNEVLSALNNVKTYSNDESAAVNYYIGIANYKLEQTDKAKTFFESSKKMAASGNELSSDKEFENNCNYMLLLCFIKEKNMTETQQRLEELENIGFEIPAADYIKIYRYYYSLRSSGNPNYKMETLYIEKYANCKDAIRETAIKLGGDSYFRQALAYTNGSDGLLKDPHQAFLSYEGAAKFENVEALYYVGANYWAGEIHYRNYFKANDYLIKAAQKGHQAAKEFLLQYGVDDILVEPVNARKTTYIFYDGYQLTASAKIIKWLHVFEGIRYAKDRVAKTFLDTYTNTIKSFDDIMANIHQLYMNHIVLMLKWCLALLMHYNIDIYSANDIIDMCNDLSLLPRTPWFEKSIEKIDARAAQLNLKLANAQAVRTQWSGTGFGTSIKGTIKSAVNASIAAGAMNLGSSILHGIGDGIVSSMNDSEIKKMEKEVFENKKTLTEFYNAVLSSCREVGFKVLEIIEKHCDMPFGPLEGKIVFGNENLKDISDKVIDSKLYNNTVAKKYDYVYALLVEKLRRRPLDDETLKTLIPLTALRGLPVDKEADASMVKYAGDFAIDITGAVNDLVNKLGLSDNSEFSGLPQ